MRSVRRNSWGPCAKRESRGRVNASEVRGGAAETGKLIGCTRYSYHLSDIARPGKDDPILTRRLEAERDRASFEAPSRA